MITVSPLFHPTIPCCIVLSAIINLVQHYRSISILLYSFRENAGNGDNACLPFRCLFEAFSCLLGQLSFILCVSSSFTDFSVALCNRYKDEEILKLKFKQMSISYLLLLSFFFLLSLSDKRNQVGWCWGLDRPGWVPSRNKKVWLYFNKKDTDMPVCNE